MPRLLPSIEVRPLAGALWYILAILIVVGVIFAGVTGGMIVWVAFWIVIALIAYVVVSKVWGRLS